MQQTAQLKPAKNITLKENIVRRISEFRLIAQDNILMMGLLIVTIFVFLFIILPLIRVIVQGFFDSATGDFSLEYFARYVDPVYRTH